jgi:hypothetical protein
MLLAEGRLPECWIPPGHILEARALLELYNDLRRERTAWAQQIHAVLFLCRSWGAAGGCGWFWVASASCSDSAVPVVVVGAYAEYLRQRPQRREH